MVVCVCVEIKNVQGYEYFVLFNPPSAAASVVRPANTGSWDGILGRDSGCKQVNGRANKQTNKLTSKQVADMPASRRKAEA